MIVAIVRKCCGSCLCSLSLSLSFVLHIMVNMYFLLRYVLNVRKKGGFVKAYAGRLFEAIGEMTVRTVSEKTGVSEGMIRSYLKGSEPKLYTHRALARGLQVKDSWLAYGEGDKDADENGQNIVVPYLHEKLFSENQRLWHEKKAQHRHNVEISLKWIYEELDLSDPHNLRWVYVDSDAMYPVLRKGNLVLLNLCKDKKAFGEGIFAVFMDYNLIFRRVQPLAKGSAVCTADSTAYQPIELLLNEIITGECLDDNKVVIVGRVVYVCHRI